MHNRQMGLSPLELGVELGNQSSSSLPTAMGTITYVLPYHQVLFRPSRLSIRPPSIHNEAEDRLALAAVLTTDIELTIDSTDDTHDS